MAWNRPLAICTANYVARESGYVLHPFDWGTAERATRDSFHADEATFAAKFEELVGLCRGLDFDAIDLWFAQLDPWWTTPPMVATAAEILQRHGVRVVSYSAGIGGANATRSIAEASLRVAQMLGAPRFGTTLHPSNEALAVELAREYEVRYGIENHPERSAQELKERLEAIPDNLEDGTPGWVGATIDTGWWATQGVDPAEAVRVLRDHILHVHLKDVRHAGMPHETCPLGDGIVDVPAVLRALKEIGYDGYLAVEHEPEDHDPTDEVRLSVERLRGWLAAL